jgi:hypothetical protein
MYATLATGVADRTVAVADLNIPDPPTGADPQRAAPPRNVTIAVPGAPASNAVQGATVLDEVISAWVPAGTSNAKRTRTPWYR